MGKERTIWVCSKCGHHQCKWSGCCQICKEWNTLEEEKEQVTPASCRMVRGRGKVSPVLIREVDFVHFHRLSTGYPEFDRLTGGGVVTGSLNLLGGEPGIGKSTLLLQLADRWAQKGQTVLYVCGEESVQQTSMRAKRLNISNDHIYLLNETLFSSVYDHVLKLRPHVLIMDSIQIMYKEEIASAPGSVSQVREIAVESMHLAKREGITTFLIGHVTKTGDLAGPRVLEHIVDTVFEFEGSRQYGYRLLRSIKNRFGPTDDIALFHMGEQGLKEIAHPSLTFLEERMKGGHGSVIIPTIEGTRPLLVEVQALVAPSSFATSSRRCTGMDTKRLSLLLAVLEKRMGYQLHALDVFVSVAGGITITEPAIDLGVILAIASSYCSQPIPEDTLVMGEVGLGGEVRSIPRVEMRLKEAVNMGFKRCVLLGKNLKELAKRFSPHMVLAGISHVEEAIHLLLGHRK